MRPFRLIILIIGRFFVINRKNYLKHGINITTKLINDIIFLYETRTKETYFTRVGNNKMTFKSMIIFMLNFVKKSIQIELDDFFNDIDASSFSITKQAFSQARKKISPIAFIKMSDEILKWFYTETPFKTFRGFRILSIDGTVLEVNNSAKLRDHFGYIENQNMKVARARGSALYDCENDMIVASVIGKYRSSERDHAMELINKSETLASKKDLILFDRGYPSRDLIAFIEAKNSNYLMRVSTAFLKVVSSTIDPDQIVETKYKNKLIKIRVLKFYLESGIQETLITNVFDKDFTIIDFKELYFRRWGIEVKYNEVKSKLQIENFTGETPITIEQDFYATMYLANMVALAKMDADAMIKENNKNKNLKYEYKVNTNILIGKLKNFLVLMLLEERPRRRSKMMKKIMKEISSNAIPIRPGRKYPRRMTLRANKNALNKKRAL